MIRGTRDEIELMAPVGSFESLAAAIQAGANSVYFGMGKLNMRSRSSINFSKDEVKKIVEICNNNGIKAYLTLNVVVYDNEINEIKEIIDFAKEIGIHAIIASDISVINYASNKNIEVHISTQVNISNVEAVKFYSQFADVIVLARELNLDQIKYISEYIKKENIIGPSGNLVRLELFIHGALCMSISGKCYLSLHNHNYSANRGECLQDCRRSYIVIDKEKNFELEIDNEYIMSPKDLCTIHFINKIIESGIKVFKIEGRARSPEYVYIVTKCYREAIDSYFEGTYNAEKIENWKKELSKVFNRGFWDGYYLGQKLGEWSHVYGSDATMKKIYAAKCTNYYTKIGVAEFLCEASEIYRGEKALIIGPTTGVREIVLDNIVVDERIVDTVKKGEMFTIKVDFFVRRSDKLYRWLPKN